MAATEIAVFSPNKQGITRSNYTQVVAKLLSAVLPINTTQEHLSFT